MKSVHPVRSALEARFGGVGRGRAVVVAALLLMPVGGAARATSPTRLPYAATGALGRLDTSRGSGRIVVFDTSSGLYSVDGVVRNDVRHRTRITIAGGNARPAMAWAFDFAELRLAGGTSVVVRGSGPLVLLSRGDTTIATSLDLDGAPGAAGGRGAGGGGGGGGGAAAVFAGGRLSVPGTISARGGAGGSGDLASTTTAYVGGPGGGGSVTLGAAKDIELDGTISTAAGDAASSGPVTAVGVIRYGATALVNGVAGRNATVPTLRGLAPSAFEIYGGGGGGGGGGSGLPVRGSAGYARVRSIGGRPGPGGGAGGVSGYAMAGGSGGGGGSAAQSSNAGGGGGGGGGAYGGSGGGHGSGSLSGANGSDGAGGGSGNCLLASTGGGGGKGGSGSGNGGTGGNGGDGGNSGGGAGGTGQNGGTNSNSSTTGAGGGGGGGGGDACRGEAPGAGGPGGAGAPGAGPGSPGGPGGVGPLGYRGGCQIDTVNDTTPGGLLGGQNVWNGEVSISVLANPGGTITAAHCAIKVTASGSESVVLTATVLGGTFAIGAGRATFTADVDDTVYLCTQVAFTEGGTDDCRALTTTPVCPDQLCGDGGVLGRNGLADSIICPFHITIAPTVDGLPISPTVIWIDPVTGDTYIPGDTSNPDNLFWDCPPYRA